jgi:undecaprenyl-phosphate 4-deoxy-4-formamido-L-arabinose transferase
MAMLSRLVLGVCASLLVSAVALVTYVGVIAYRLYYAQWEDALAVFWDRDILAFFLVGMLLFGLGLVGEYVGRIYHQVRARPRYMIRAVLERPANEPAER